MECQYFKSVATSNSWSVVSSSPPPLKPSSLSPVPRKLLSFSINKILGLEDGITASEHSPNSVIVESQAPCRRCFQTPCSRDSCSDISPGSSPYSDNSSSNSDSEPDQVSTHSEQPPRKKRQRTTFSPIEVWELERAFKRSPYLTPQDEEELVRRLGIMAKSLKHWFQNRRAKLRKEERYTAPVYQTNPSDQFDHRQSRHHSEAPQVQPQSTSDQTQMERVYYTALFHRLEDRPCHKHKPVVTRNHYSSFKSNQFRRSSNLLVPMLHCNQFQLRPANLARLPFSRGFHRYQPY